MRVGSLVKYQTTEDRPIGLGIIIKVHEILDYYGHIRVDIYWINSEIRTTESIKLLREVLCE